MTTTRVLIAEDNLDHQFFIRRALEEAGGEGVSVEAVGDGAEVLDYVHRRGEYGDRERPHLILLDLKMPRVGGLEVLAQLKQDDALRSIPIAVLSSSDRPEDIDEAYRRGTNTYVVKPTSFPVMREALRTLEEFWTDVAVLPDPPT